MAETIPTENIPLVDIGEVHVWTSASLKYPTWEPQPQLFLDRLECLAGPGVDQATFTHRYGEVFQFGAETFELVSPLELVGQFVKVEILDGEGGEIRLWYGIIEVEANEVRGLSLLGQSQTGGVQRFAAYGLARLLERVYFRSTTQFHDPLETTPITIARGVPFNLTDDGYFGETGNRSVSLGPEGTFLFSDAPELGAEWTAFEAAEYLLTYHVPLDESDEPVAEWGLAGNPAILEWYLPHERTDGRSVKDLLDALIPRKRGVGYWVSYDEEQNSVFINLFSITGSDLLLPTGTLPANPAQFELDFNTAISLERVLLRNIATTTFHRIVAQGERRTSTATYRFGSNDLELVPAWTDQQQQDYLDGASLVAGYGSLQPLEQARANAVARAGEELQTVFRRFQLSASWSGRVGCLFQNNDPREYWVAPRLDPDGEPLAEYDSGGNAEGDPLWRKALRFLPYLPLRQQLDYSGERIATGDFEEYGDLDLEALESGQYLRPLFFTWLTGPARYVQLHNLDLESAFESDGRDWSVSPEVLPKGPGVDLHVVGGPQQFIAEPQWIGAAETDWRHDPSKNAGLDYAEFYAVLAIELDSRAEATVDIAQPVSGAPKRTLYIDVANARLDYVLPYCVIGLGPEGPIQTTSGGFVRDDRERLQLIAESAATWYGTERQQLEVRFRKVAPVVQLGDLIVAIPDPYRREEVNTVVTRLAFHFEEKSAATEFETGFPEFDLI